MYLCSNPDCGAAFEEPRFWKEGHGDNYTFNEPMSGCPICGEYYDEAAICLGCQEWIATDDLTLGFCEKCGAEKERQLDNIIHANFAPEEVEYLKDIGAIG